MDYIDEIFNRMRLKQITAFLTDGAVSLEHDEKTYKEQLKAASDPIHKRLEGIYEDVNDLNAASAELYNAFNAYEKVFTELGMKAGARIFYQLLHEDEAVKSNTFLDAKKNSDK